MMLSEDILSQSNYSHVPFDIKMTELEIFTIFDKVTNKENVKSLMNGNAEEGKSQIQSNQIREIGNAYYKAFDLKNAFISYNKSLGFAPRNSIEYGLALANRSAIFYATDMYKECVSDIKIIIGTEYPEHLRFKIYLRQSKCLFELNQYALSHESCQKALEYLDTYKDEINSELFVSTQSRILKIMLKLSSIEENNAEIIEERFPLPELRDGENPNFLSASNAIKLTSNNVKGRYVVASKDIKKGDVLFVEKPFTSVHINSDQFRYNYCANCLMKSVTCIPCNSCITYFYCSDDCRQKSWDTGHKWICFGVRKQMFSKSSVWILILHSLFKSSEMNFKTDIEDDSVYGNTENNFPFFDKLVSNKDKMEREQIVTAALMTIYLVIYLKSYTDYFEQMHMQFNYAEDSHKEFHNIIGGRILKILLQLFANKDRIMNVCIETKETDVLNISAYHIGYGIYISSPMLNHSCVPNALVSFHNSVKIIKAINDIKKGSEITVDYKDYRITTEQKDDKNFLNSNYKFICECSNCNSPYKQLQEPWLCVKCQGKAFTTVIATKAKCIDCDLEFLLNRFIEIEMNIRKLIGLPNLISDYNKIELMRKMMNEIYHESNIKHEFYYVIALSNPRIKANAAKCIEISTSLVKLWKHYGISKELLNACAKLTCVYATFYVKGKKDNLQRKVLESLDETKKVFSYFASPKNIKDYENKVLGHIKKETVNL